MKKEKDIEKLWSKRAEERSIEEFGETNPDYIGGYNQGRADFARAVIEAAANNEIDFDIFLNLKPFKKT
jgi:hypothetical protein